MATHHSTKINGQKVHLIVERDSEGQDRIYANDDFTITGQPVEAGTDITELLDERWEILAEHEAEIAEREAREEYDRAVERREMRIALGYAYDRPVRCAAAPVIEY